jgi:hypothetical protein
LSQITTKKKKKKSSACEKGATESHVTGISKAVPLMASAWFTLSTHFMLSIGTCNTTSCRHRNILECVPFAMTYRPRSWLQVIIIALGWWHDVFKWESRLTLSIFPPETSHIYNTWRWQTHIWMSIWPLSGHSSQDWCLIEKQQTLDFVKGTKQRSRCVKNKQPSSVKRYVQNILAPLIGLDRVICLSHTNDKRFIAKDHRNSWQWPLLSFFWRILSGWKQLTGSMLRPPPYETTSSS